jgi:hypothetical protein
MNVTIDLSGQSAAALEARAADLGKSTQEVRRQVRHARGHYGRRTSVACRS